MSSKMDVAGQPVKYHLYTKAYDDSPRVLLLVEGVWSEFVVDTACNFTSVSFEQVKAWDLQDKVKPSKYYTSLGCLTANFQINGHYYMESIQILNYSDNLLGLDILARFCCIINLRKNTLMFCQRLVESDNSFCCIDAVVNGIAIEVVVDTGSNSSLTGPLHVAKALNLPLTDISHKQFEYSSPQATTIVEMEADVTISALGRTKKGIYTVQPVKHSTNTVQLGIMFLRGSKIVFCPNGMFSIDFQGRRSSTVLVESTMPIQKTLGYRGLFTYSGYLRHVLDLIQKVIEMANHCFLRAFW